MVMRKYINILTESFISESAMNDALNDLHREGIAALDEIASDYGLDPAVLRAQFEKFKKSKDAGDLANSVDSRKASDAAAKASADRSVIAKQAAQTKAVMKIQDRSGNPIKITSTDLEELGDFMADIAGSAFPDGDPSDSLIAHFHKMGWDPYDAFEKVVPRAAKLKFGTSWYGYLAQLWDDVYADAKHDQSDLYKSMGGDSAKNPWK